MVVEAGKLWSRPRLERSRRRAEERTQVRGDSHIQGRISHFQMAAASRIPDRTSFSRHSERFLFIRFETQDIGANVGMVDYRKLLVLVLILFVIMGSASFVVVSSRQRETLSVPDLAASLVVGILLLASWMLASYLHNKRRAGSPHGAPSGTPPRSLSHSGPTLS